MDPDGVTRIVEAINNVHMAIHAVGLGLVIMLVLFCFCKNMGGK